MTILSSVLTLIALSSLVLVSLISGPLVSIRIAILSDTFRMFSTISVADSIVAWALFILATFIPASYKELRNAVSHLLSEIVQTIFVFFLCIIYLLKELCHKNNEYWLQSDARLRQDFNITTGAFPDELEHYKYKSKMKEYYAKAGIKTARYHMVSTLEEAKKFIAKVGYPVVVKPDNGVGASATYKIKNDAELELFYRTLPSVPYIMEEFINGLIVSYDGICDENSKVIFETSHVFPTPIMDIVNNVDECYYYSVRKIPEDLQKIGKAVIASFKPRARFFHCEYFRLLEDKEGLAKKGEILGLEVNMRPPGGYTPDMMNFANDIDVYAIYAQMVMGHVLPYNMNRPYYCAYVGRRNGFNYKNSEAKILARYEGKICMHENMPDIVSAAMGNDMYTARFKTEKEVHSFIEYCTAKKG